MRGSKEPQPRHGCTGGRRGFARQNKAPRRSAECKQLGRLQERLREELRHPSETGPSEGLFGERVQLVQPGHGELQTAEGLRALRRRAGSLGAFFPHFQELAK